MAHERSRQQNPERRESDTELRELRDAQSKEIERRHESKEHSSEKEAKNLEGARHEVEKATAEKAPRKPEKSPAERRNTSNLRTKASQKASFSKQMKSIQSEMPATKRTFSKVIHNKAVENASEAAGSTIARPNAILAGSFFAFALTLSIYLWANYVGYPLSGFETIAAFILGWILGITFDFTRIMITGKK